MTSRCNTYFNETNIDRLLFFFKTKKQQADCHKYLCVESLFCRVNPGS